MKKKPLFLIYLLLLCIQYASAGTIFNVKDYGAAGDGKTIDTKAIESAISTASGAAGDRSQPRFRLILTYSRKRKD